MSNEALDIVWDDEQEDFDVLSDLQRTLPGVGITSGYRTPEYQEELRRRGYNPAKNSAHLYGDAIDISAFPGMTLAEGAEFLRQKYPNGKVLYGDKNHLDHVHFSVPGYGRFPVFGGAKAAGVSSAAQKQAKESDEDDLGIVWDDEIDADPLQPATNVEAQAPEMETRIRYGFDTLEEPEEIALPKEVADYYVNARQDPNIPVGEMNLTMRKMLADMGRAGDFPGEIVDPKEVEEWREYLAQGGTDPGTVDYESMVNAGILPLRDQKTLDPDASDLELMAEEGLLYNPMNIGVNALFDLTDQELEGGINKELLAEKFPDATPEQLEEIHDQLIGEDLRRQRGIVTSELDDRSTGLGFEAARFGVSLPTGMSPADLVPFAGRGSTLAMRGVGAVTANQAIDAAMQASDLSYGAQDRFSNTQNLLAGLAGAGFHAGLEAIGYGVRRVLGSGVNDKGSYLDVEAEDGSTQRVYRGEEGEVETITPEEVSTFDRSVLEEDETPPWLKNPVKQKGYDGKPKTQRKQRVEGELEESGKGLSLKETINRKDILTSGWTNAPEFLIVNNVDDLDPKLAAEVTADMAEGAKGITLPDGRVVVMTDNLENASQIDSVIFHEALGHYGLAQEFGEGLNGLLNRLYEGNENLRAEVDEWMAQNPDAYNGDRTIAIEERLAELSEDGAELPPGIMQQLKMFFSRMARRMGIKDEGYLGDAEVIEILRQAHERVVNGERIESTIPGMRYIRGKDEDYNEFKAWSKDVQETEAELLEIRSLLANDPENLELRAQEQEVLDELTSLETEISSDNKYMKNSERIPSKLKRNPGKQKQRGMAGNINLQRLKSKRAIHPLVEEAAQDLPDIPTESFKELNAKAREIEMSVDEMRDFSNQLKDAPAIAQAIRIAMVREVEKISRLTDAVADGTASDQQILNFIEANASFNAILESVSQIGNAGGRLLNSMKLAAQSSGNADLRFSLQQLGDTPLANREVIQEVAQQMRDRPEQTGRIARDAMKPGIEDYLNSARYNAMLSHPATHVVNMIGTGSHFGADLSSKTLGALIGKTTLSKDATSFGEIAARLNGAMQAAFSMSTYKNTLESFKAGVPMHRVSKIEHATGVIKNKYASYVLEGPTRALAAEDEWWRNLVLLSSYYGEAHKIALSEGLTGQAFRDRKAQLIENPTPEMLQAGNEYAEVIQFVDDPITSKIIDIEKARTRKPTDSAAVRVGRFTLRQIVPFVRTIDALMRAAVRYSPAGIASESTRAMLRAGGSQRHEAIGRLLIGQAMLFTSLGLAAAGRLTGSGPENYEKRREMESMVDEQGRPAWQANSIKIGDTWYSYRGMEPFSIVLSTIADSVAAMERNEDEEGRSLAPAVARSIIMSMNDNTFTSGIGDFFAALQGGPMGENAWNNYVAGYASSYVPGVYNFINEDPMIRETSGTGTLEDRVAGRVQGRAGFENLPQRYDVYGRPMERAKDPFFSLTRFRSPKQGEATPAMIELSRLASQLGPEKALISREDRGSLQKLPKPLDIGIVQEYQREVGILTTAEIDYLIENDPEWGIMTDDERIATVKKVIKEARKTAKEGLFPEYYGDAAEEDLEIVWDDQN